MCFVCFLVCVVFFLSHSTSQSYYVCLSSSDPSYPCCFLRIRVRIVFLFINCRIMCIIFVVMICFLIMFLRTCFGCSIIIIRMSVSSSY